MSEIIDSGVKRRPMTLGHKAPGISSVAHSNKVDKRLGQFLVKPAIGSVVVAGITKIYTYPTQTWISIFGIKPQRYLVNGAGAFVGLMLSDVADQYGWVKVGKGGHLASMLTEVGFIMGSDFLIHAIGNSKSLSYWSLTNSLIQAVAASMITRYSYEAVSEFVEKK